MNTIIDTTELANLSAHPTAENYLLFFVNRDNAYKQAYTYGDNNINPCVDDGIREHLVSESAIKLIPHAMDVALAQTNRNSLEKAAYLLHSLVLRSSSKIAPEGMADQLRKLENKFESFGDDNDTAKTLKMFYRLK